MPNNETKKNLTAKPQADSTRKAPGTRIGTLYDWREGSIKSVNQRHGQTIRDGR
jgi:hypothetical protein